MRPLLTTSLPTSLMVSFLLISACMPAAHPHTSNIVSAAEHPSTVLTTLVTRHMLTTVPDSNCGSDITDLARNDVNCW